MKKVEEELVDTGPYRCSSGWLNVRHTCGCPACARTAHQRVKDAINITWDATMHIGDEVVLLNNEEGGER